MFFEEVEKGLLVPVSKRRRFGVDVGKEMRKLRGKVPPMHLPEAVLNHFGPWERSLGVVHHLGLIGKSQEPLAIDLEGVSLVGESEELLSGARLKEIYVGFSAVPAVGVSRLEFDCETICAKAELLESVPTGRFGSKDADELTEGKFGTAF
jgi:hypothetical protein